MAFSLGVEMLNLRLRRKAEKPVHLHHKYEHDAQARQTVKDQLELDI
jgi:hypothetical protein